MELEVTDMPAHVKGKMAARVKSYKNELARLQKDFVSDSCVTFQHCDLVLFDIHAAHSCGMYKCMCI